MKFVNKSMLKSIISFSLLYWIYYSIWIYSQIFSNSSNVVFSIIILENLQKIFVNNKKIKTINWIRLLIFDDKINFYFLNMFLYMTSVVYCRTFLHFTSSSFNNYLLNIMLHTHYTGCLNIMLHRNGTLIQCVTDY